MQVLRKGYSAWLELRNVSQMVPLNTGPLAALLAPAFQIHHPVSITAH